MKVIKKFNLSRKATSQYFFSYWKKLFFFFALPLMLLVILLSYYEQTKNELRENNYETQEFFEVYYNFCNVIDEITKNHSYLIVQDEFVAYMQNANSDYEINNLISLFSSPARTMSYVDAVHFYCFNTDYVVSTRNGNKIKDFYYREFFEKYEATGNADNITYEKGNPALGIPETINLCYGYYRNASLKGLIVYSLDVQKLNDELFNSLNRTSHNIVLTNFDDFYYSSAQNGKDKAYYTALAQKLSYSDEKNIDIKHFEDTYSFKIEYSDNPLKLIFEGKKIELGMFLNLWIIVLLLLFINITVVIASLILARQMRTRLLKITGEFMQHFSLDGENAEEYTAVSREIFDNLRSDEKIEMALPKQMLNLRKTQLYALQMQISPHFMYNTLNSINLMVMNLTKSDNDISRLIMLLSELLYDVLDTKKYIITLKKEIEYSKKFLEIENIKRKNSVEIIWDVEKELLGCGVIKFILQPVLENIFRYAFRSVQEKKLVSISIHSYENGFCIIVKDNGIGITGEKLEEITKSLSGENSEERHIGLVNVNKRIQMLYGSDYGLKIYSAESEGTTVKIFLPKINNITE